MYLCLYRNMQKCVIKFHNSSSHCINHNKNSKVQDRMQQGKNMQYHTKTRPFISNIFDHSFYE